MLAPSSLLSPTGQKRGQPSSPTGSSAMNFTTKKGRFHNWSTLNRHNKLDVENQLKGYDMKKDSKSFLITIKTC